MSFLVGPDEGHRLGGAFDVVVRVRAEQANGIMAVIEEIGSRSSRTATGSDASCPKRRTSAR